MRWTFNFRLWLALAIEFSTLCECLDVSSVSVSVGQTAILPCHVSIQGNIQVAWKDKDLTTLTFNEIVYTDDKRLSIQHLYQNDWDLRISGVRLSDAGNYTCCVVITSNCQTIKIVSLVIQIPPMITSISNDVTISTGGSTTLVCNATGVPQPSLKWTLNRPIADSSRELNASGVYQIVDAQPNDTGKYECSASNGVLPVASRSVQVVITFKPQVTVPYREVRQTLNADTLLECHIRSNPIGEYYWEKNGRRLDTEPGRYRFYSWKGSDESEVLFGLTVYNLRSDDFTFYTCVAKNAFGIAMESALISVWHNGTLRIVSPPRDTVAQTGQSTIIDCSVEGMTKADQLVWWRQESSTERYIKLFDSKNGGLLSTNVDVKRKYGIIGHYNLEIKSVVVSDAGFYHCHVSSHGNYSVNLAVVHTDSSIAGCSAQTSGTPTIVTIAIVASIVGVFVIVFVVVVLVIVKHYRKQLNKRSACSSTAVKTERYSNLNPNLSYM